LNDLMPKQEMTIDSREVAKMVGKDHSHLLRDIKGYIEILGKSNFGLADFFIENTYIDLQGKRRNCYKVTKKGCEMIAHKLTGEKGVLFTATYIERFHDMEQSINQLQIHASKQQLIEARLRNAKSRQASLLLKMADNPNLNNNYKQVLFSYASSLIADKPLIPLPTAEEKTYSAGEIGKMLGVSANKIGRLTNEHNLKTEKYGKLFHDKSKYSNKEVETFRYYESIVPELRNILQN